MATNRAHYDITATDKSKRAVDSAKRGAQDLKRESEEGTSKLTAGLQQAGGAGERLQSVLSKVLIPTAIVGAVGGLVEKVKAARSESEKLAAAWRDIVAQAELSNADLARTDRTDAEQSLLDIQRQRQAEERKVLDGLDEELKKRDTLFKQVFRAAATGKATVEVTEEADEILAQIGKKYAQQLEIQKRINEETARRVAEEKRIADEAERAKKAKEEKDAEIAARVKEEERVAKEVLDAAKERERIEAEIVSRRERDREAELALIEKIRQFEAADPFIGVFRDAGYAADFQRFLAVRVGH